MLYALARTTCASRASRPVNRATHYHKCPHRARPTRKSVSQIARVGLCHLSPAGRAPRPLCAPPRCARLVSTERSAIRSRSFFPALLPRAACTAWPEWRFRVRSYFVKTQTTLFQPSRSLFEARKVLRTRGYLKKPHCTRLSNL